MDIIIKYTTAYIRIASCVMAALVLLACGDGPNATVMCTLAQNSDDSSPGYLGDMELSYAKQFSVSFYEDDFALISIADGNEYVLVPEGANDNNLGHDGAVLIHMPITSTYLAATAAMDLYRELDALSNITACSTKAEDYSIPEARELIENGKITYVGKYSAPDYEKLLELGADIAIESTMIYHSPKTKEALEAMDIPVIVERSSYEEEPLGRVEWIKLYGLLTGRLQQADDFFESQVKSVNEMMAQEGQEDGCGTEDDFLSEANRPKVVFFYVSSNGYVNVRKPKDYVSKMIEMAGGTYALESLILEEENALSTVNISWEDFYVYAKDADILIYNGTIDGGVNTVDELVGKNEMLGDCRAISEQQVYCTNSNMFQETSRMGDIIIELGKIIRDEGSDLKYFYPLI